MGAGAVTYGCAACGAAARRWSGRCSSCGAWNSLEPLSGQSPGPTAAPVPLAEVDPGLARARPTGLTEVDRVLGGGLLPGSVTLLYGEPGVGKSTLLLQVLMAMAARGDRVLLVSAEESAAQVRARAERLGALSPGLLVSATPDAAAAAAAVDSAGPELVVVDSVQTLADPTAAGPPGSLAQVRACADRLVRLAKGAGVPLVLVGQVTKGGDLAGPRALEHLVDTVVTFEGDRHHALRCLRAVKHRFGTTGEIGLFEMGEGGLTVLDDPAKLLLGDRHADVPGSAVTALLEGRRPLLVELQALVLAGGGTRRRSGVGVDAARLAALLAVLECRAHLALGADDVFVSAAGGLRAAEPAADLALSLAVASAKTGRPLPDGLVVLGEVGLAGEVRQVPGTPRRLAEAARLGFTRALVPEATLPVSGLELLPVGTLAEALAAVLAGGPAEDRSGPEGPGPPEVVEEGRAGRVQAAHAVHAAPRRR
ncbi:MAG TPA: DNA repair protein RadA [Acidimicrobiales bacterium]|nr:DNA repair protein RadA [Acidimicrobiales bacterium]